MKLFVIALIVVAIFHGNNALTDERKAKVASVSAECIAQEKTTKEAVKMALDTQTDLAKVDKNVKCYAYCFMNKSGLYVKGVIQPARVEAILGPLFAAEKLKAFMMKCNGVKGTDDCETAFMIMNCYYKQRTNNVK